MHANFSGLGFCRFPQETEPETSGRRSEPTSWSAAEKPHEKESFSCRGALFQPLFLTGPRRNPLLGPRSIVQRVQPTVNAYLTKEALILGLVAPQGGHEAVYRPFMGVGFFFTAYYGQAWSWSKGH